MSTYGSASVLIWSSACQRKRSVPFVSAFTSSLTASSARQSTSVCPDPSPSNLSQSKKRKKRASTEGVSLMSASVSVGSGVGVSSGAVVNSGVDVCSTAVVSGVSTLSSSARAATGNKLITIIKVTSNEIARFIESPTPYLVLLWIFQGNNTHLICFCQFIFRSSVPEKLASQSCKKPLFSSNVIYIF